MRYQIRAKWDEVWTCVASTMPDRPVGQVKVENRDVLIRREYKSEAGARQAWDRHFCRRFPREAIPTIEQKTAVV